MVRVPIQFVRRDGETAFCYVARVGRIGGRRVELGPVGTSFVEVTSGLRAGDVVLDSVVPGAPLTEGRRWRRPP